MKALYYLLSVSIVVSCRTISEHSSDQAEVNQLINENSPYLLQHAYNPVNWYPWGDAALEKAKREDKMLLISIGYTACHWCHVMERESFEDTAIAKIMNDNFVCIKVDREERPDIDNIYLSACQLASGEGCGWPLNAFALPDGRPVWAGTYFPKDPWLNLLNRFSKMWIGEKVELQKFARKLTEGIEIQDQVSLGKVQQLNKKDASEMAIGIIKETDLERGGRKGEPKYPKPNNYKYLLHYHKMTKDAKALEAVNITLRNMAAGGIYDQLGGGFSRYSVDEDWIEPHFEKMLYDNGQLLSLYSQAFQTTGDSSYLEIINQLVEWLDREMTDESGGFYSTIDADSDGQEGKFYVWSVDEIEAVLSGPDLQIYKDYYHVKEDGNWQNGRNILYRDISDSDVLERHRLSANNLRNIILRCNAKMFHQRSARTRPTVDDKILTSWNALMIIGLVDAYRATQNQEFLDLALRNAGFIKREMLSDGYQLWRSYREGKVRINAFLDDYAFTIQGFLEIYQATFEEAWLKDAKALTDYAIKYFYDDKAAIFNYSSTIDPPLIAKKKVLADGDIPSSNSAMGRNLNFLSHYFYDPKYLEISDLLLNNLIEPILSSGQSSFFSNWALLYLEKLYPTYEIAIIGEDYQSSLRLMQSELLPNTIYLGGKTESNLTLLKDKLQSGRTMIYVCQNKVCQLPVEEPHKALDQIEY